jgi:hypothetical protein
MPLLSLADISDGGDLALTVRAARRLPYGMGARVCPACFRVAFGDFRQSQFMAHIDKSNWIGPPNAIGVGTLFSRA